RDVVRVVGGGGEDDAHHDDGRPDEQEGGDRDLGRGHSLLVVAQGVELCGHPVLDSGDQQDHGSLLVRVSSTAGQSVAPGVQAPCPTPVMAVTAGKTMKRRNPSSSTAVGRFIRSVVASAAASVSAIWCRRSVSALTARDC